MSLESGVIKVTLVPLPRFMYLGVLPATNSWETRRTITDSSIFGTIRELLAIRGFVGEIEAEEQTKALLQFPHVSTWTKCRKRMRLGQFSPAGRRARSACRPMQIRGKIQSRRLPNLRQRPSVVRFAGRKHPFIPHVRRPWDRGGRRAVRAESWQQRQRRPE